MWVSLGVSYLFIKVYNFLVIIDLLIIEYFYVLFGI